MDEGTYLRKVRMTIRFDDFLSSRTSGIAIYPGWPCDLWSTPCFLACLRLVVRGKQTPLVVHWRIFPY